MKSIIHELSRRVAWAISHDTDEPVGVFAAPGARAHGDVSNEFPVLSNELLDVIRASTVPIEPTIARPRDEQEAPRMYANIDGDDDPSDGRDN